MQFNKHDSAALTSIRVVVRFPSSGGRFITQPPARRSFVGEGTQKAADLSSRVDDGCQIGGFACRHNSEEICAAGESHPALSQGATD